MYEWTSFSTPLLEFCIIIIIFNLAILIGVHDIT